MNIATNKQMRTTTWQNMINEQFIYINVKGATKNSQLEG